MQALWFHNVLALEPCISVNMFWRHLDPDFYQRKDLYGNKDLALAQDAAKKVERGTVQFQPPRPASSPLTVPLKVDEALALLDTLPTYYRRFYAQRLAMRFESCIAGCDDDGDAGDAGDAGGASAGSVNGCDKQ